MSEKTNNKKKYKAIDLFAGIGGIRLGFVQAFGDRIKFVYANEIDEFCCETYQANFGENPQGDITEVDAGEIPDFNILLGGFPCQAFSIAGEKRGFNDTRGTLFFHIAKILKEKKPEAFLLENVKHLKNHDRGRTFQVIKDVLTEDLNYFIHTKVLNAKNFGVPQNRERIFIVGFRKNLKFEFPEPTNEDVKIDDILQDEVEDSYYLSHQYLEGLKEHRARHEAKGHGFGYEVIPRDGIANALVCGGMGRERNLVKDEVLPNAWEEEGDDIQLRNEEGLRKMTPREWARLQGFPDSFEFPVSMTQSYKQLGNSIAVPVIKAIAEKMKEALDEHLVIEPPDLNEKEKKLLKLLEKMYSRKEFTKTGVKYISTIQNFVENYYLRISNVKELIHVMERYQIAKKINDSQIKFSRKINDAPSKEVFLRRVKEKFKSDSQLSIVKFN
mgnify:CR=1 FL=1